MGGSWCSSGPPIARADGDGSRSLARHCHWNWISLNFGLVDLALDVVDEHPVTGLGGIAPTCQEPLDVGLIGPPNGQVRLSQEGLPKVDREVVHLAQRVLSHVWGQHFDLHRPLQIAKASQPGHADPGNWQIERSEQSNDLEAYERLDSNLLGWLMTCHGVNVESLCMCACPCDLVL